MSDQKIIDTIAGHRHVPGVKYDMCQARGCDWRGSSVTEHAEHVLAALRANSIAVVELPEPDSDRRWELAVDRVSAVTEEVVMQCRGLATVYDSPICARERAAALLAAADAAERAE